MEVNFTCKNHRHSIESLLNLKPSSVSYVEKLTSFCCMKGEANTLYQIIIIVCVCIHCGTSVLEHLHSLMLEGLFEQNVPKFGHKTCSQSTFSSVLLMTKYRFYDSDQSHFYKAFITS